MSNNNEAKLSVAVTFRHTESTDALKSFATEKVIQKVKKYVHSEADIHVVLTVEKLDHSAEIHLVGKDLDITAKGNTEDLYSAIDKAADNLETQLRKQKEKLVQANRQAPPITPAEL